MSADSEQLERSALERKDRDELMTIATALGGKPGSRAKKADIIDLVLQLTGVTAGAADEKATGDVASADTAAVAAQESASSSDSDSADAPAPRPAATSPDQGGALVRRACLRDPGTGPRCRRRG